MDLSELQRHKKSEISRHPWEIARLKIIQHLLKKHTTHLHHILDLGSGDCFILKQLKKNKYSHYYTAVDNAFTPALIEELKTTGEKDIRYYTSTPAFLNPKSDCVLLLDVLEHCENDKAVLYSIINQNIVAENTKIIITVPAFQFLFSEHDKLLGHFRRYNKKQLKHLVTSCNLKIAECGYFFFSLLFIRSIHLLFEKWGNLKAKRSIDNWESSRLLSRCITTFLLMDFYLSRLLFRTGLQIPGLSVYCICTR